MIPTIMMARLAWSAVLPSLARDQGVIHHGLRALDDDRCHVESCPWQPPGEAMRTLQSGTPETGRIEAVIVVIAILAMIFWRDVIKILLMVALLLFIIIIASGAVAVIDVLQHVIK